MKHLLLTTIAAVLLVGCGESHPPDISIWEATATGNIEAVKQHLAAGTDVNTKNSMGWTPLHNAAVVGQKETVKLLITRGANVNAKDKDGVTPLDAATGLKQTETASILRKHGGKTKMELEVTEPVAEPPTAKAPDISIHDAARTGNIEAIKQHIAAGTHVDSELITGWTPLYFAAQAGYTEIAELLLSKGADVNAKTATGDTPLDQAIGFKHTEIVDLLRKHGGKHLTFHNAVLGGDVETVKEFLAAGTDVNAMTDAGHTPLDLANPFRLKSTELADLLRKHGGKTGEELKAKGK